MLVWYKNLVSNYSAQGSGLTYSSNGNANIQFR